MKPRLDRARDVNATHLIDTTEADEFLAAIGEIVNGPGVDLSLEATGNAGVVRRVVEVLAA